MTKIIKKRLNLKRFGDGKAKDLKEIAALTILLLTIFKGKIDYEKI